MKIDKNVNDEMLSALTNILSVEEHLLQESKIDITKIKDIREIRDNIIILLLINVESSTIRSFDSPKIKKSPQRPLHMLYP